jgi:hypothetical protein
MVTSSALAQISITNQDTFCMISAKHALLWHLTLRSVLSTYRQEKKLEFMGQLTITQVSILVLHDVLCVTV